MKAKSCTASCNLERMHQSNKFLAQDKISHLKMKFECVRLSQKTTMRLALEPNGLAKFAPYELAFV